MRVNIKPLSINKCFQGRRFKTPAYKSYEKELLFKLKKIKVPEGKLKVTIIFAHSSPLNDIDNACKPFIDILQKKYGFNDKEIYELNVKKVIVAKGEEYIDFQIDGLE